MFMWPAMKQWGVIVCVLAVVAGDAVAQSRPANPSAARPPAAAPHAPAVEARVTTILDELEQTGNFAAARHATDELFDQVLAYASLSDFDAFRAAGHARRLVRQLEPAESIDRVGMLRYLRANPRLGQAIAFAFHPENEPAQVYALLDQLRQQRGDRLNAYANLAAALCLVHDRELTTRINEHTLHPPDPLALFDYYTQHERQMFFGIRDVPVELLIYVVDVAASIDEMRWALDEYAGHPQVGRLFFTIRYDEQHFRRGTPKRVSLEGYTLPNIRQFGGVCADQAHFAVTVGKAIGVPAAYARGRSSQISHAWAGFLQQHGQTGYWNFDHGRYAAYQGVRGVTRAPQTRQWVDDSYVSLLAELIGTSDTQRHNAAAMTDATLRLHAIAQADLDDWAPAPLVEPATQAAGQPGEMPAARDTTLDTQLALLEAGLRESNGHLPGWLLLAHLADAGQMTLAQKQRWSDVVMRLCGQHYPDFAVVVLRPMVRTVEDVADQDAIWERMFQTFRRRHDLAAEIRMEQGRMWEQAGEFVRAGRCYEDVIERYANDGPFVLDAVVRAEAMLHQADMADRVLQLYGQTWSAVHRPRDMHSEFQQQSNWFRLGMMYATKLAEYGHDEEAQHTLAVIERQVGG